MCTILASHLSSGMTTTKADIQSQGASSPKQKTFYPLLSQSHSPGLQSAILPLATLECRVSSISKLFMEDEHWKITCPAFSDLLSPTESHPRNTEYGDGVRSPVLETV